MIPDSFSEALARQSLPVLYEIRDLVNDLISYAERSSDHDEAEEVLAVRRGGAITYRQELVSCGKGCKGCPHGPYWYGYWREGGKTRSKYIGKSLKGKL
jgi:hypothetical protein